MYPKNQKLLFCKYCMCFSGIFLHVWIEVKINLWYSIMCSCHFFVIAETEIKTILLSKPLRHLNVSKSFRFAAKPFERQCKGLVPFTDWRFTFFWHHEFMYMPAVKRWSGSIPLGRDSGGWLDWDFVVWHRRKSSGHLGLPVLLCSVPPRLRPPSVPLIIC